MGDRTWLPGAFLVQLGRKHGHRCAKAPDIVGGTGQQGAVLLGRCGHLGPGCGAVAQRSRYHGGGQQQAGASHAAAHQAPRLTAKMAALMISARRSMQAATK